MIDLAFNIEIDDLFSEFFCYYIECECGCDIEDNNEDLGKNENDYDYIFCEECGREYKVIGKNNINNTFVCEVKE